LDRIALRGLPGYRLVFIDGHFAPVLSRLPENGPEVRPLSEIASGAAGSAGSDRADGGVDSFIGRAAESDSLNPFTALNTAFLMDGACIRLPENFQTDEPVYLLFHTTGRAEPHCTHPRNLIVASPGSSVSIVEEYSGTGAGPYFTNSVTEVFAARGASVDIDRFQHEGENAFHVSSLFVRQESESTVTVNSVSYGSAMARHNIVSVFEGERAECTLNGLTLTTGSQHIDNHTVIDHATPRCTSHELYKAILEGSSRGVFNGKIFVRRDAQKTDAKQTNKSLLLSDEATIDTKPQLEIFADDVRCTHGATIGQLDEEQIFYLRSRGMGLEDARDLLTNAFASDVLNRIRLEPLREHLQAVLHVRLCKGRIIAENL
ncbi:MAG TPA: Fe-S cluster assembly protein SufD, partial [Bacteroidota bacterium]|nr:Fe-S cluster assembly protein SufD [Bacteroidota bacterium]